jgi:small-conductance mechanosensitive channel
MSLTQTSALQFYGNTIRAWLVALAVLVLTLAVLVVVRVVAARRLALLAERTASQLDDLAVGLLRRTRYTVLLIVAIEAASLFVVLPANGTKFLRTLTIVALLVQAALWGNALIAFWIRQWSTRRAIDAEARTTVAAMNYAARVVLWAIIVLLVLDNLGINITALVTGLGISGVAVALAVQNILGDLFAALSIVLDKPFVVGDSIDVGGDFAGTVQRIGLKSTRIRSVSGELIVISNGDLLKSRIRNYRGQVERRVLFRLGVDPATPPELLARIPAIVRQVIEAQPATRFDRSHFKGIGEVALEFETVYFMTDPGYNRYMDTQQAINLELVRRFAAEGIAFARPLRTVVAVDREVRPAMGTVTVA